MLDKLHSNGYVHGDVRQSNLVFDDEGKEGYLIDYDLCGRADQDTYPVGYYVSDFRHDGARECEIMTKYHDGHSLAQIIISSLLKDDSAACLIAAKLQEADVPLEDILHFIDNE